MEKKDIILPNKRAYDYANLINGLLGLTMNKFEWKAFGDIINQQLNVGSSINMEFLSLLIAIVRSWESLQWPNGLSMKRDSEGRKKSLDELRPHLEKFCKTFKIDPKLALIGIRLRQGDTFIIEDEEKYLATLLPTPKIKFAAMALCGVLTQPVAFRRKFEEYPAKFELTATFESSCEHLCDMLKINPIVPRLVAFEEEALKLVDEKFNFPRKSVRSNFLIMLLAYLVYRNAFQFTSICTRGHGIKRI